MVFALLAADSLDQASAQRVLAAVTLTVLASIVAHGLTAAPLAARYGAHMTARRPQALEHAATPALRARSLASDRRRLRQPDGR